MTKIGYFLLTAASALIFFSGVSCLKPGGKNVKTTYETYYVTEMRSVKRTFYRRICRRTCSCPFCWCRKTVCRNVAYTKWVPITKKVARTRPIYSCYSGWKADYRGEECTIPICSGCCQNGGYCVSPGKCSCTAGWTGSRCISEVDECAEKIAGCAHICTNTIGSFNCSCKTGYYLTADAKSCKDIDECSEGLHNCQHDCLNTPGGYKCSCRPGFDLSRNGEKCIGRPCFPIFNPINGKKSCSGYTAEEICNFECFPGYDLIGSKNRTCTASKNWTGTETKCEILPSFTVPAVKPSQQTPGPPLVVAQSQSSYSGISSFVNVKTSQLVSVLSSVDVQPVFLSASGSSLLLSSSTSLLSSLSPADSASFASVDFETSDI